MSKHKPPSDPQPDDCVPADVRRLVSQTIDDSIDLLIEPVRQQCEQLRQERDLARLALRSLEWSGEAAGADRPYCPCCGAEKPGPHALDCEVAVGLGKGTVQA